MKKYLIFLILFAIYIPVSAQHRDGPPKRHDERIGQLEKVKLIEILDMDEETTLRFFARRDKHFDEMKKIHEKREILLETIEDKIKNDDQSGYMEQAGEIFKLEEKAIKMRRDFISSLTDILTETQIGKMMLFEVKFKEHIKDLLIDFQKRKGRK